MFTVYGLRFTVGVISGRHCDPAKGGRSNPHIKKIACIDQEIASLPQAGFAMTSIARKLKHTTLMVNRSCPVPSAS